MDLMKLLLIVGGCQELRVFHRSQWVFGAVSWQWELHSEPATFASFLAVARVPAVEIEVSASGWAPGADHRYL